MKKTVKDLTIDASLCAIIAILTFVPYVGYIPLGFVSVTDIHIVVIIGAILLGPKHGLILGTFFGLSSLIRSGTGTAQDITFIWPWVSILPRALFGFLTGVIFKGFNKIIKKKAIAIAVTAVLCTLMHTILVFIPYLPTFCIQNGLKLTTHLDNEAVYNISVDYPVLIYCFVVFISSGIFEALFAGVIATPICLAMENFIMDKETNITDDESNDSDDNIDKKDDNE